MKKDLEFCFLATIFMLGFVGLVMVIDKLTIYSPPDVRTVQVIEVRNDSIRYWTEIHRGQYIISTHLDSVVNISVHL